MLIPHAKHLEASETLIGRSNKETRAFLERLRSRPSPHTFWGEASDAVILVTEGAGSVATFMISQLTNENKGELLQALEEAKSATALKGVATAHALLGEDDAQSVHLFESVGFAKLATLQYMEWSATQNPRVLSQITNATFYAASALTHDVLCSTLEKTFIGSLDCPAIHGKRNTQDIIASHKGFEQNDLSLWFTILSDKELAGVLFMNHLQNESILELAYLGITPEMRNKGIAIDAMSHAVNQAVKRGCNKIVLAVDDTNVPAISLYKKVNFRETTKRVAMFCPLH